MREPFVPGARDDPSTAQHLHPPAALDVFRRATALLALWYRADGERAGAHPEWLRRQLAHIAANEPLEPAERDTLRAPVGSLSPRRLVESSWRIEGAAVLAWALGLCDLYGPDELASVDRVSLALGWQTTGRVTSRSALQLRPATAIHSYAGCARAVHWRFRELRQRRTHLDFAGAAERLRFGDVTRMPLALVDGDLAIDGRPVTRADPERVAECLAASTERHIAAQWLVDATTAYSDSPIDT